MNTDTTSMDANSDGTAVRDQAIVTGPRTYRHNGHVHPIGMPYLSDVEMAGKVRMLMRGDLDHEGVVCCARDRILSLSQELANFRLLAQAAKYLLLGATGREDGPTSWNKTRERWMKDFASMGESR